MAKKNNQKKSPKSKSKIKIFLIKALHIAKKVLLFFLISSVFFTILYRFVPPPITPLMVIRFVENSFDDQREAKIKKDWVSIDKISPNLIKAAIAGEDANFMTHFGFDIKAMQKAFSSNQKGKKIKGGSTITQQTAKNVFLSTSRSYIRKAFEAYFTLLIELTWSKERIMEVYLNIIEMGDGIYGCEEAAQTYFNKSAKNLTKAESAFIIACLPNPRKWNPAKPSSLIVKKQQLILRRMSNTKQPKF